MRWTTTWAKDDWDVGVLMTRIGSFPVWQPTVAEAYGLDSRIGPQILWNMSVGKQLTEDMRVRVNVNNVLDDHGPDDITNNSYPYTWYGYGALQGRSVGLQLDYRF